MDNHSKWIRIERPLPLPDYVRNAVNRLSEAGFVAYVVGGSVRDFLLGRKIKDYDLVTNARPDEMEKLFPNALTVGRAFGVIKVPIAPDVLLEIATFREDLEYRDYRHPTAVRFAGPLEDGNRRDFTVNALFYDPKTTRVLDVTPGLQGLADLKARVIRAIGLPEARFEEDALRLLRAIRFAHRLGFVIEERTLRAVQSKSRLIAHVSGERIRDELTMIWRGPSPARALTQLKETGLLKFVLPELDAVSHTVLPKRPGSSPPPSEANPWNHTLKVLETLSEQEREGDMGQEEREGLFWAAVLQNIGKPVAFRRSGGRNFNGHEIDGARLARVIGERLRFSRTESERIAYLIEDQLKCREVFQMREATLQRFLRQDHMPELLALHRANVRATDGNGAFYVFCRQRLDELASRPALVPVINGDDLVQLGFEPGPKFSEILRVIEDLQLESKITSKAQALEYVVAHYVR